MGWCNDLVRKPLIYRFSRRFASLQVRPTLAPIKYASSQRPICIVRYVYYSNFSPSITFPGHAGVWQIGLADWPKRLGCSVGMGVLQRIRPVKPVEIEN
jgi:hypothetical protein